MEISGFLKLPKNQGLDGTLPVVTESVRGFIYRIKNQKRNFMFSTRTMIIKKTWRETKAAN